jgi:hypothetical protein
VALSDTRFTKLDPGELAVRLEYLVQRLKENGEAQRVVTPEPSYYAYGSDDTSDGNKSSWTWPCASFNKQARIFKI